MTEESTPDQRLEKYRCARTQTVHHVACDQRLGSKACLVSQGWEVDWNTDGKLTEGGPVSMLGPQNPTHIAWYRFQIPYCQRADVSTGARLTLAQSIEGGSQAWCSNCPDPRGLGHVGATLRPHWEGSSPLNPPASMVTSRREGLTESSSSHHDCYLWLPDLQIWFR